MNTDTRHTATQRTAYMEKFRGDWVLLYLFAVILEYLDKKEQKQKNSLYYSVFYCMITGMHKPVPVNKIHEGFKM